MKRRNNHLRKRLLQYEAKPPDKVWNAIAVALEDNASLSLKEKLYGFEATPPAHIWNNISGELPTTPVAIPIYKRYAPLKYIAAAILIVLLVFSIICLDKSKESSKATVSHAVIHPHKKTPAPSCTNIETRKSTGLNAAAAVVNPPVHYKKIKQTATRKDRLKPLNEDQ